MISREIIVMIAWLSFAAVWVAGAFGNARTVKRAVSFDRFLIAFIVLVAIVAARIDPQIAVFRASITGGATWALALGVVLLYGGVAFAIWARVHLGRFWSGTVTLKEGHQLIRSGPYAIVRNPIYTGIISAFLGAALVLDRWFVLILAAVLVLSFLFKIQAEEKLLREQFGEEFAAYEREVKKLVPGIW